jgi:hypothetical protein
MASVTIVMALMNLMGVSIAIGLDHSGFHRFIAALLNDSINGRSSLERQPPRKVALHIANFSRISLKWKRV